MDRKDHAAGIAIVEDEQELINIYKLILKRMGVPIIFIAYDGHDAVKKFSSSEQKPDIIIMDHRLPIMTGLEATEEILKMKPQTRVIFISADEDIRDKALEAGAVAFIKKPASLSVINDTVDAVIKGCQHPAS
ncbi:response regulator [Methanocella sp. CWC-04]|uniref:Response regulator n=1 Tax=Methanooceanicella nereidis TaxID=2052831 RepID=A0AAP2RDC3_9EURY|nr:response regulator [Methanocella sp. CWC-04]MCD1295474.1 response regulator [Methanocella sp. CWC-04]